MVILKLQLLISITWKIVHYTWRPWTTSNGTCQMYIQRINLLAPVRISHSHMSFVQLKSISVIKSITKYSEAKTCFLQVFYAESTQFPCHCQHLPFIKLIALILKIDAIWLCFIHIPWSVFIATIVQRFHVQDDYSFALSNKKSKNAERRFNVRLWLWIKYGHLNDILLSWK